MVARNGQRAAPRPQALHGTSHARCSLEAKARFAEHSMTLAQLELHWPDFRRAAHGMPGRTPMEELEPATLGTHNQRAMRVGKNSTFNKAV